MRVGLLCHKFVEWGGGMAFLQLCLQGLESVSNKNDIQIVLLIPNKEKVGFAGHIKKITKAALSIFQVGNFIGRKSIKDSNIIHHLKSSVQIELAVIRYAHTLSNLEKICIDEALDVLLPSFESLGPDFPIPWVGYLYDFQHKEMPSFFAKADIRAREEAFSDILKNAKTILVNSKKVKADIDKYYPLHQVKIFSLPFTPFKEQAQVSSFESIKLKYNIPEKYFVISNQFWRHKDHLTAILAFAKFYSKHNDFFLVCTGEAFDYRHPDYIQNIKDIISENSLENNVLFTGYIGKDEVLSIISRSKSLIQPTTYEGGPGGGAVYDAFAFGVPIILSDIEINKEVTDLGNVIWFKCGDPHDLYSKMEFAISKDKVDSNQINSFIQKSNDILGIQLYNAIMSVCQ